MSKLFGVTLLKIFGCIVLLVIMLAIAFPMFDNGSPTSTNTTCQCNMKQIGTAFRVYLSNWDDKFPTNRTWTDNGKIGNVRSHVKLTRLNQFDSNNNQIIYHYGVNWVEALYKYVDCVTKQSDNNTIWQCPEVKSNTYPEGSKTAFVSYAFNRNLVEFDEKNIKDESNLMVMREMDRLVDAELRPMNKSTKDPNKPPISPFLSVHDNQIGETKCELHGGGSNILFADGHVKTLQPKYFPEKLTTENNWDPVTKQWYNFATKNLQTDRWGDIVRNIAVTP